MSLANMHTRALPAGALTDMSRRELKTWWEEYTEFRLYAHMSGEAAVHNANENVKAIYRRGGLEKDYYSQ